jgi:hypothetical protein
MTADEYLARPYDPCNRGMELVVRVADLFG